MMVPHHASTTTHHTNASASGAALYLGITALRCAIHVHAFRTLSQPAASLKSRCRWLMLMQANHAKQHYTPGRRLPASYINFYMPNGGIIMPAFGSEKADAAAAAVLAHVFPERRIVPVYSREILLGGGNIHCITQQQPLSWGMQGALQLLKPLPIMHAVTIIQSYCSLLPKCTKFNTSPTKTSFHYFLIFLFALSPCPLFFCFLPSFRYRLAVRSSLPPSL